MFYGFPVILVDALVCQKSCNGRLRVKADIMCVDGMIVDGVLFCDACGCDYKIESGILNLLSAQPELDIIMQEEIKARDKEASKYDDALAPRYEKEVLSTLKQIGDVKNKKIVEFACGTGRITIEILTK